MSAIEVPCWVTLQSVNNLDILQNFWYEALQVTAYIWRPLGFDYVKPLKSPQLIICNIFGLLLTHRVHNLTEKSSQNGQISHITYCMWICKFYKIVRVILEVPFKIKTKKLIQNKFTKYFFMKFILLTMHTCWSSLKLPNNTYHGEKHHFLKN